MLVFSSTKLEIRAEKILPESEGEGRRGWGRRYEVWGERKNDPNNVHTCK
jgi:hypothetical protein